MTWSFPIGRFLGSELRVHATFFLLLLWVALAAYTQGGLPAALENTAFIVVLFACVVAHEYGHALMARRYGIKTPDITLLPIGGMARLERLPEKPGREIAVALAGPAVNVVIWMLLTVATGVETQLDPLVEIEDPQMGFAARLAAVNLFLAVFNLIPAFPMDGGRVLRAVLAIWLGRVKATQTAAQAGQIIAFLFGLLGLTSGNPILLLIAVFIFMAAAAEKSDVVLRHAARNLLAREAMITQYEALAPDDSLQAAGAALIRTTQHEFPVIGSGGEPVGLLTRTALFQHADEAPAMTPVRAIMDSPLPAVPLTARLDTALDALQGPAVAVVGPEGQMVGYITRENIGELMVVSGQMR